MRYTVIACEIFFRELCLAAARCRATTDLTFLPKGMHNDPPKMRQAIQDRIDAVEPGTADAILLGFALCGNVAAGLRARQVPLVIPRAHDCITLFLGSRERYNEEFTANPGTYYYTSASFERSTGSEGAGALGATSGTAEQRLAEYTAKYGAENARYLLEMEATWSEHYSRAAYIDVPELRNLGFAERAAAQARKLGLTYAELPADLTLLNMLLDGVWPEQLFLVVPPGYAVAPSYDELVIKATSPQ